MLSPKRHSARMSKITNGSLTRSGTGCYSNSGRQRVKSRFLIKSCGRVAWHDTNRSISLALIVGECHDLIFSRRLWDCFSFGACLDSVARLAVVCADWLAYSSAGCRHFDV